MTRKKKKKESKNGTSETSSSEMLDKVAREAVAQMRERKKNGKTAPSEPAEEGSSEVELTGEQALAFELMSEHNKRVEMKALYLQEKQRAANLALRVAELEKQVASLEMQAAMAANPREKDRFEKLQNRLGIDLGKAKWSLEEDGERRILKRVEGDTVG